MTEIRIWTGRTAGSVGTMYLSFTTSPQRRTVWHWHHNTWHFFSHNVLRGNSMQPAYQGIHAPSPSQQGDLK